jgi:hypothetical protein
MVIKYANIIPSNASQNFPKLQFWSENKPSGNPDKYVPSEYEHLCTDGYV